MRHRVSLRVVVLAGLALVGLLPPSTLSGHAPTGAPQRPNVALPDLLTKAGTYLAAYEGQLAAVIAAEAYTFEQPGLFKGVTTLQSDLLLLDTGDSSWIEFRDVFAVDHQAVRDHDARLAALLTAPAGDFMAQAQKIADESARYNVGMSRNINVPTMALTYLSRRYQPGSAFKIAGTATVEGRATTVVSFQETAAVPLIRVAVGTAQTSGRFWIAEDTGAVLRTELKLKVAETNAVKAHGAAVDGGITVDYAVDPKLKFLVPLHMTEHFDQPSKLDGYATYSDFRAFAVDVKALQRSGGGGMPPI